MFNDSKWYKQELENYTRSRIKAREGTPKSVIGITIFFVILAGIMLSVYFSNPDYNIKASLGFLGGMYAFMMIIILLTQKAANKKTDNPSLDDLEKHLSRILTTREALDEFDREMLTPTHKYLVNTTSQQIFVTEHYLVDKGFIMGGPYYSIARLDEITWLNYSGMRDKSKINPLAREYYVDLLNDNNQKVIGLNIKGKSVLMELKQILNIE